MTEARGGHTAGWEKGYHMKRAVVPSPHMYGRRRKVANIAALITTKAVAVGAQVRTPACSGACARSKSAGSVRYRSSISGEGTRTRAAAARRPKVMSAPCSRTSGGKSHQPSSRCAGTRA